MRLRCVSMSHCTWPPPDKGSRVDSSAASRSLPTPSGVCPPCWMASTPRSCSGPMWRSPSSATRNPTSDAALNWVLKNGAPVGALLVSRSAPPGDPAPSSVASWPPSSCADSSVAASRAKRQAMSAWPFSNMRLACSWFTPWLLSAKPRTCRPCASPRELAASQVAQPWSISCWLRAEGDSGVSRSSIRAGAKAEAPLVTPSL